ncbi:MAG: phosphoenolpyruvate--protein phosphotransferase [Bacteroidota bacterium]
MIINGIGVSPGISIGRAFVLKTQRSTLSGLQITDDVIPAEIEKFNQAISISINELESMIANCDPALSDSLGVLEAHIELINDPEITNGVVEKITQQKLSATDALIEVINNLVALFKNMDDQYLSERAADVQDIGTRLLRNLNPAGTTKQSHYPPNSIIIAEDLTPSDTIAMDITCVMGFATQIGGQTSHAAIIAKSRGIPAVVGCGEQLIGVKDNDTILLNGLTGVVTINPDSDIIQQYEIEKQAYQNQRDKLNELKDTQATTIDDTTIKLLANIGNANDMQQALAFGAEGAGLFRTELLFIGRDAFPTEDEQFEFYKAVAVKADGKPVTVRTLDIGGDKPLSYLNLPAEQNPFLGYRAIRICLDRADIFITQLKAILRASVYGHLKIMFPMISGIQEIRKVKEVLKQAKKELEVDNILFNNLISVGIMIEVPSAAITADLLAKEVDFFSIGTNDLCQYTLAVDRMNEQIKDLYSPFNPGVLRLIQNIITQGRLNNIPVSMCGEMASDPKAALLLLGMGLTDFSMSATAIPHIKNIIRNNSMAQAQIIHQKVMAMDNATDITKYLQALSNGIN